MKNHHPAIVLLGCLLAVQPCLMPAANAAEDTHAYPVGEVGRGTGNGLWTIPPISRQWERPAGTRHWTIPPVNQRWNNPQEPLRWTIPRTADDMK